MATINCRFNSDWQLHQVFAARRCFQPLYSALSLPYLCYNQIKGGMLSLLTGFSPLASSSFLKVVNRINLVLELLAGGKQMKTANLTFPSTDKSAPHTAVTSTYPGFLPQDIAPSPPVWSNSRLLGCMMAAEGRQCCCCAGTATYLCCCLLPLLPLCGLCAKNHSIRFEGQHLLVEIAYQMETMSRMRWTALHSHLRNCKCADSCVELSVEEVRACITALERRFLPSSLGIAIPMLEELELLADQLTKDLQQGWDQVCPRLFSDNWTDCSEYTLWMLRCTQSKSLFHWQFDDNRSNAVGLTYSVSIPEALQCDLQGIQTDITQATGSSQLSDISVSSLAVVSTDLLCLFDYGLETWTQVPLEKHDFHPEGCLLLLKSTADSYICTEGDSYNTAISHICIYSTNGFTHRYIQIQAARSFPGVLLDHHLLYLFGGVLVQGEITAAAELFDADLQRSIGLPPMLVPRRSFTPCKYQENIYLCGGFSTTLCEKYHISSQIYALIPLILPEISDNLAYWRDQELVIVTRHLIVNWPLNGDFTEKRHVEWCGLAGCSGLLCIGDMVFNAALGQINAINVPAAKRKRYLPQFLP